MIAAANLANPLSSHGSCVAADLAAADCAVKKDASGSACATLPFLDLPLHRQCLFLAVHCLPTACRCRAGGRRLRLISVPAVHGQNCERVAL